MTAFETAIKRSATPGVWNDIAYELALKGSHLDQARSFAESAVSSTAASLRNVSLSQVSRRDLSLVSSLASYWDTLGWVAFSEGKVDAAEQFVRAAWQLGQSSEAGDHLGQIELKRADKKEAARDFAMAMNVLRPSPETHDRLVALAGSSGQADELIHQNQTGPIQARTFALNNLGKLDGAADFFVLLSGSGGALATTEAAAFINGSELLKPMSEALRSLRYAQSIPGDSPTKIIRRGTLTCKASGSCSFILALPQEVRSPN